MSWLRRLPSLFGGGRSDLSVEDFRALTSWLHGHGRAHPTAEIAVVGRQGCVRADGPRLRDELLAARQVLATKGIHVARSSWEGFADRLADAAPIFRDEEDLFRLAVLGQLERGRARLAELVAQARASARDEGLPIVLAWMASGTFDDAALDALVASLDPEEPWWRDFDSARAWLVFARPSDGARALLEIARKHAKKAARAARKEGDGDFRATVRRDEAAVALLTTVVASWDGVVAAPELAGAFQAYVGKSVDYYALLSPVAATCLEMKLLGAPRSPTDALARLRAYVQEPITPRPDPVGEAAPALRAIDAFVTTLAAGNGLTVREGPSRVQLLAEPSAPSRDFI